MKWLAIAVFSALVLFLGIRTAMQTGEKSPILAKGSVTISPELAAKATGIRTLFIVIHDMDSPMPMPFGAVKFTFDEDVKPGKFYDFVLTKERMQIMGGGMGGGGGPPARMRLKARLDRDGMGGMDQPGDLSGEIQPVALGDEVEIAIAKVAP